jgi:lipoic acid synthetase
MLGLGESLDEVLELFAHLRQVRCDLLTVGQYLQPSQQHLPVERFVSPCEFETIAALARRLGFSQVASGPFVRSSYHAGEMVGG